MKHAILLLTIILFGCTKETVTPITIKTVALAKSAQVSSGIIIDPHIISDEKVGTKETVTYSNSAVAEIILSKTDPAKSNITVTYRGKSVLLTSITTIANNIKTIQLLSNSKVFHSFQLNALNQINNLVISDESPYQVFDIKMNYVTCMRQMFYECSRSWGCSIFCGAGIVGCSTGWSLACVGISLH